MHCLAQTLQIFSNYSKTNLVHDTMVNVPSRKRAPNHKFDHLFSYLLQVSTKAFEPGRNISSYKQDSSTQGNHEDKQRVTFKLAGYGVLIYSCEDGYTIKFYPRNDPPPKKLIEKGNSPTHSQIIFMLDALPDQYYTCGMENIFISEKFLRAVCAEKKSKTMLHCVCRKKRSWTNQLFCTRKLYKK